jgi:type VI protein secretion system component VasK
MAEKAKEGGQTPLTTKEGWHAFVDRVPTPPRLLPQNRWKRLGEFERERYDQARLEHHAQLVVVATPTVRQIANLLRRLVLLNRHQVGARRGLIVTGSPATGKTTAITHVGKPSCSSDASTADPRSPCGSST